MVQQNFSETLRRSFTYRENRRLKQPASFACLQTFDHAHHVLVHMAKVCM
jgi:hypothetical protein